MAPGGTGSSLCTPSPSPNPWQLLGQEQFGAEPQGQKQGSGTCTTGLGLLSSSPRNQSFVGSSREETLLCGPGAPGRALWSSRTIHLGVHLSSPSLSKLELDRCSWRAERRSREVGGARQRFEGTMRRWGSRGLHPGGGRDSGSVRLGS